jgi:hypothetical protein
MTCDDRRAAPDFLLHLARGGSIGVLDVVLAAAGTGGGSVLSERDDLGEHPRVCHAQLSRDHVRVWADERGLVTLADGLAGRRELSVEAAAPGTGAGRSLSSCLRRSSRVTAKLGLDDSPPIRTVPWWAAP